MQQWFLPVGLSLAIVLGLLEPGPGARLNATGLIIGLVPLIFLVNGYQTRVDGLSLRGGLFRSLATGVLIGLLISPWLGLLAAEMLALPAMAAFGLVVMSAMPPTLSSGVIMTSNAGGNTLWAMLLTIALNLIGIFTIPFMLDLTLSMGGGTDIAPWPLLQRLLLIVLLPFVIGVSLRRLLVRPAPLPVRYIPSSCIVVTMWMSISASHDTLLNLALLDLLALAAGALLVHLSLLLICHGAGRGLNLKRDRHLALMFVTSQKTLPLAIGVLAALNQPDAGALVVCIVFHFLQLMFDSVLAARLRERPA